MTSGSGATAETVSDENLLERARQGEDEALALLYERHHVAARAVAWSLVRSRDEIDDIVAEAFTDVIAAMRRGGGPDTAFRPYLLVCVRHAAYRRRGAHGADADDRLASAATDERAADPVGERAVAGEDRSLAREAYESLPERWRQVLWYTVVEGRPMASTAGVLGLAPNATAALAMRAREGLREAYLQRHVGSATDPACRENLGRVGAYVRGNLGRRDRRHVTDHLRACTACSALTDELTDVNRALRASFGPIVAIPAAGLLTRWGGRVGLTGARLADLRMRMSVPTLAASAVVVAVVGGATVSRPLVPDRSATSTTASTTAATSTTAAPVTVTATSAAGPPSSDAAPSSTAAPATTTPTIASEVTAAVSPATTTALPPETAPKPSPTVGTLPDSTVTLPPVTTAASVPTTLPPVTFPPITLPGGGTPPITLPDLGDDLGDGLGEIGHAIDEGASALDETVDAAAGVVTEVLDETGLGPIIDPVTTPLLGLLLG